MRTANLRAALGGSILRGVLVGWATSAVACGTSEAQPGAPAATATPDGTAQDASDASDATADTPVAPESGADAPLVFGGSRPATLRVPAGYEPERPAPLVVLLHGYSLSGKVQEMLFRFTSIADQEGFLFVAPDGTLDPDGKRFWNVASLWCSSAVSTVDDIAYITSLVGEIAAAYAVDPKRVYAVGHSNGGALAHALACARPDVFAAVASLAGPLGKDPALCNPARAVSVLHMHGTADATVGYAGGTKQIAGSSGPCSYAGAVETIGIWAAKNGCAASSEAAGSLDLDSSIAGEETAVTRHPGCSSGGAAELWTIQGAGHMPGLASAFPKLVYDFLKAHARP
jgi:polyhydroxybutyrate depolymerase